MSTEQQGRFKKLLAEPTLHFVLIAAGVFALYGIFQAGGENVMEIDQREIDARIFMQEMARGEPLTEEQRQLVATAYVEEQILVQEALAMELDNDARIHDLLAQKMRHVLSGDVIQPTAAELSTYYQRNLERYRTLPTVSVAELVFNNRDELGAEVVALLASGAAAAELLALEPGNTAPLPNVNRIDLSNIFDPDFAEQVFAAEAGQWSGPFLSNRGQHWLQVTARRDASLPALEDITDRVRLDWIAEEEEARLQQEIDRLWDRYTIIITDAETD